MLLPGKIIFTFHFFKLEKNIFERENTLQEDPKCSNNILDDASALRSNGRANFLNLVVGQISNTYFRESMEILVQEGQLIVASQESLQ
jgi:hypothetical protein